MLGNVLYDLMSETSKTARYLLTALSFAGYIGINVYRADLLTKDRIQMSDATFSLMGVLCAFFVCVFVLCFPKNEKPINSPTALRM